MSVPKNRFRRPACTAIPWPLQSREQADEVHARAAPKLQESKRCTGRAEAGGDGIVVDPRVLVLDQVVDAMSRGIRRVLENRVLRVVLVQETLVHLFGARHSRTRRSSAKRSQRAT